MSVPDTQPPQDAPTAKSDRLGELRAELKRLDPAGSVKVERVDATKDSKGHVKASWERKRVAHVVEPPHTLDDAEIAVLAVVTATLRGS